MTAIFFSPQVVIVLFILVVLSFFFSAAETAIIGLSKLRLRHMVAKGVRGAKRVQQLVTKMDSFIAAILIGNNFVSIAISAIVTAIFVHTLGYRWGVIASTITSTFFILIFCEITPKMLAAKHAENVSIIVAPIMGLLIKVFRPFILIFTGASNLILRVLGLGAPKRSPLITEEELRMMIEIGKEEGVLSDEERKMLHRIFEFGDTQVRDVMVPYDKMIAINIKATPEELVDIFAEKGHARLPVYDTSVRNITGVIYARDLLYLLRNKELFVLQDLVHPPYYVQAKMRVNELLREFQAQKIQIAIVVDEKKNALGLLTLEDLIEEIVGEIEEAHHNHKSKSRYTPD